MIVMLSTISPDSTMSSTRAKGRTLTAMNSVAGVDAARGHLPRRPPRDVAILAHQDHRGLIDEPARRHSFRR